MSQAPAENKMGVMPVGRLLLTMSVPMMLSMLVQALYNVVDSMFVARLSEDALTAVTLSLPIQTLMIGIGTGTGVGVNAFLSKSLGEGNQKNADKAAVNSLFLAACGSIVFTVLGLLFARRYYEMQTSITAIVEYGVEYLAIVCAGSVGLFFQIAFEKLLQSTGKTVHSMIAQVVGAVANIILDPILIFGLLGFPALGVAGAAIATVIGQLLGTLTGAYFNFRHNKAIHIGLRGFRPDGAIIGRIYSVGVPSIVMSTIGSVMNLGMNRILISFTSTANAVFGVYINLQSFVFMPIFGLNNGMVPIIAFNYGARKPDRIKGVIKRSILSACGIMLTGLALFTLIPETLLGFYEASETMLEIGVPAFRTISLSFVIAGFCIVTLSVLQALGHGLPSLLISAVRQVGLILPAAFVLSRIGGLPALWYAYPFAEFFTALLCVYFMRQVMRKEIEPLYAPPPVME